MSDDLVLAALVRLEAGLGSLRAEMTSMRADMTSLGAKTTSLRAEMTGLRADMTSLRVDVMARIDRLENKIGEVRDDIAVISEPSMPSGAPTTTLATSCASSRNRCR